MIIDSHSHLHDEKFSLDLKEVLARAHDANISHLITVGCDIETTTRAKEVSERYDHVFFTAGFHPHEAKFLNDTTFDELRALAQHQRCVAVGEIGLDYFYLHSSKDEQRDAFIRQLDLARDLDLPVVIHLRDAFDDCIAIIKKYPELLKERMVIHCFSGTLREAKIFEELGCLISLSGIVTFNKPGELRDVAKNIDLRKLLVETDCPYLAPHPHRGKRNEPSFIVHTLQVIADARNENVDEVMKVIHDNAVRFFKLPPLARV